MLKTAYTHFPDVPWYASYLLLVQAVANVVLLYCTIESGYTRLRLRLYLLYFATAGLFFIHNLQFTSAAFVAGQSGILLLMLAVSRVERGELRGRIYRPLTAALVLLILASLVRREVFYPVCALGLVTVGLHAAFTVRRTANLLRTGVVLAAALVVAVVSWRANDAYYGADPGWRNFYAYNKLRVKFNDEAWVFFSERTANAFADVQWSQNDLAMLAAWFYDDEERYSLENLEKVMSGHPWYLERFDWSMVGESLRQVASDRITLAIVLALPIMVYCVERRRLNFALIAMALVTACGLILFLVLFQKTPPSRVYAPALAFPLALCAVLGRSRPAFLPPREKLASLWLMVAQPDGWRMGLSVPLGKLAVGALVALMMVSVYKGVYPQYRISRDRIKTSAHVYDLLARLEPGDDKLFVCWAASFPYEAIRPFESLRQLGDTHLLVVGWPQHTPLFRRMKERFQISDLAEALYRRSDLYLIAHPLYLKFLRRYVREHFQTPIVYHTRQMDRLFDVFQATARSAEDGASERVVRPLNHETRTD